MFIHLHNHSEYSLLSGQIRIKQMVARAKQYDMPAVALTDYGNLFGAVEFYESCLSHGIKPLLGAVLFLPSHDDHRLKQHRRGIDALYQLVVLIENETGYRNLCQLITRSYLDGFYYKPRVDMKLLSEFNQGLIALSGGWDGAVFQYLFDGQERKAREVLESYRAIFDDRLYLELQENGVEGQHDINLRLLEWGQQLGIPPVATNNCHYLDREDSEAFETLRCIQVGGTLHGTRDQMKFARPEYFFKDPSEMEELFAYCPEALRQTEVIAQKINFDFDLKSYHFPKFVPPEGLTLDEFLDREAHEGFEERWPEILRQRENAAHHGHAGVLSSQDGLTTFKEKYRVRLNLEVEMIKQMGFSGYFLIVSDFIQYAKSERIPVGPGRGSAAGSLVAYCLKITDLDPLPYNLLFERFLNPERISMPDVDIDFCMHGRDRVLQYVGKKYGNVSQIITFGKMKARAVIRDVGRVMELPYSECDQIAKLIPNSLNITLDEGINQEPRLKELIASDPQVERLIEICRRLEGLNRHASTHAAGVVISDRPLTEFLPLYRGSNGDVVTQFDMKAVEKIGLIKFDFLGLKTLTVIQDALKIIQRTQGQILIITDCDLYDESVYHMLSLGDTRGVFQLESAGMKDLLVRMKPSTFEDLIAILALYRPGPLGSGMVDDFINRKQGKTNISYDLPELRSILEDTYGVIVYQEQVMQIASALAGYTLGEADILRRAMGKKKVEEMEAQKIRFLKGASERQIPTKTAEKIFDLMAKFAEYGFNKSHSAAYAFVTYQTAYLKAHYPTEYLAAVLTTEMHNTDRILYYLKDCEAHGIQVLPPDINEGFYGFSVIGANLIRFGLGAIKNVGRGAVEAVIETRNSGKAFSSFYDFCERVDVHRINRRVLESLIKAGCFDTLEPNRALLMAQIDIAMELASKHQRELGIGQTNMFGLMTAMEKNPAGLPTQDIESWASNEKLAFEKEALGFYFSGHPLKSYEAQLRQISTANSRQILHLPRQQPITIGGMIMSHRIVTTKKSTTMAFVNLEDLAGQVEVIVFPKLFKNKVELIQSDFPIVVKGTVERSEEGAKILAEDLVRLNDYLQERGVSVHLTVSAQHLTSLKMDQLQTLLKRYCGKSRGYLHILNGDESECVLELKDGLDLNNSDQLMSHINGLFEQEVVAYRTG